MNLSSRYTWYRQCVSQVYGINQSNGYSIPLLQCASLKSPCRSRCIWSFKEFVRILALGVLNTESCTIAPMLFGALADNVNMIHLRPLSTLILTYQVGRRIIYASCLLILSLTCVGLALTPTSDYWLLLLLRCFQSTGSASTIALGKSTFTFWFPQLTLF